MQNQKCTMEESTHAMLGSPEDIKQWEEAICPVCLEHPHNAVLLRCSSYQNGCRPFICNTSSHHSNCLDQFRKSPDSSPSSFIMPCGQMDNPIGEPENMLTCPLCRGHVYGWFVIEPAREFMNSKTRSCSTETCEFYGNYMELRKHARSEHPTIRPSSVDPERQENWTRLENETHLSNLLSMSPSLNDLGLDDNEQEEEEEEVDEMQIFEPIETEVNSTSNVDMLRDILCLGTMILFERMRRTNYDRVNRYISRQNNRWFGYNARLNHGNNNPNMRNNVRRILRDNRDDGHDNVNNNLNSRQNNRFERRIPRNSRDERHNNVNNNLNPRQNNSFRGNNTQRMRDRRLNNSNRLNYNWRINGYNTRGDDSI